MINLDVLQFSSFILLIFVPGQAQVGTAEIPEPSEEQTQPPRGGSGQPSAVAAASRGATSAAFVPPSPVQNGAVPPLRCGGHIGSFYVPKAYLQSSAPRTRRRIRLLRIVFFEGKGDIKVNEGGSMCAPKSFQTVSLNSC